MKKKSAPKAAVDALHTGKPVRASEVGPKTVQADDTPETKPTKPAKQKAAEDQFAKADAAADPRPKDEVEAEEIRVRSAALGY